MFLTGPGTGLFGRTDVLAAEGNPSAYADTLPEVLQVGESVLRKGRFRKCFSKLFSVLLSDMKIASFNAQRFGVTKLSDPDVLSTLIKVKHSLL